MKTKEEILAKRIKTFPSDGIMRDESIKTNVHKSMQEYADEQSIAFVKFISGSYGYGNILGLWYSYADTSKDFTTEQLLQIFKTENENNGKI